jgi:hypothetical protein
MSTLEEWVRNRYLIIKMPLGREEHDFIVWGHKIAGTNYGIYTLLSFFVAKYEGKVDMSGTDEEILRDLQNGDPENVYGYNGLIV